MTDAALPTLGLMFVLGLRHGLDPDHVAVIDNIVFRMVDERPRLSCWTGTMFAAGHSLAVAAVALGVSVASGWFTLPVWSGTVIDAMVVSLLLLVGTLNLAALSRPGDYVPVGWRARLVPASLRMSTHPLAVVAVGVVFGLVFDTATQAAAWGAAATTRGGIAAAAAIALAFATGMVLADTLDSQIVSRLLRTARFGSGAVRRYRRAVGWLIVALSYGMAALAVLESSGVGLGIDDASFTVIGVASALTVTALLVEANRRNRSAVAMRRSS
ncbi:nickel permease [Sphingomonas bacterium]|uniref:HoxN/HupN/NixA family nickel/cobalt transporter n=1 Tax=Sphingomonas bacterium TaxID=1895847 RepID=UPI0020C61548|nr:nickel permease [Sphingomonas bacterium]